MIVSIHTNVIGLVETRAKDYLIFEGVAGGNYRTKTMALFDGQKMISAAYRRGYQAMPVKIFASKSDLNLLHFDYSVVRMTSAPAKTPPQGTPPQGWRYR